MSESSPLRPMVVRFSLKEVFLTRESHGDPRVIRDYAYELKLYGRVTHIKEDRTGLLWDIRLLVETKVPSLPSLELTAEVGTDYPEEIPENLDFRAPDFFQTQIPFISPYITYHIADFTGKSGMSPVIVDPGRINAAEVQTASKGDLQAASQRVRRKKKQTDKK